MDSPQPAEQRRAVRYRAGSAASAVRVWVTALPYWSVFRLSEVPGDRAIAAKTLSEIARSDPAVERITKGCYVRGDPARAFADGLVYRLGPVALAFAGPGSGYADASAVNKVAWNWHPPLDHAIAVVGRAPRAVLSHCRFKARSNVERRSLNWAEVTMLEAARGFPQSSACTWDRAVHLAAAGVSVGKLGPGAAVRAHEVLRVGRLERGLDRGFHRRLEDLADAMPETSSAAPAGPL